MNSSQLGRAGELALSLYTLVTSAGRVELFSPLVDDDHVDLVAGLRGALPALGIQVKATDHLDRNGLVEARAAYPKGQVREDAAFLYAVLLLESVSIRTAWLVPSADFNRLTYREPGGAAEALEFRASPERSDRFSEFRVPPLQLGTALMDHLSRAKSPPIWLLRLVSSAGG